MSELDEEFWKPLGEKWWNDSADTVGATNQQKIFACARMGGKSQTESARIAGYSDTGDKDTTPIRQIAYRTNRTNAVQNLIELATAANGDPQDRKLTRDERRRIYERLARKSDPSVKIKALEKLAEMDEEDAEQGDSECESNPTKILEMIAELDPFWAFRLAKRHGYEGTFRLTSVQTDQIKKQIDDLMRDYRECVGDINGHSSNGAEANKQALAETANASAKPNSEAKLSAMNIEG